MTWLIVVWMAWPQLNKHGAPLNRNERVGGIQIAEYTDVAQACEKAEKVGGEVWREDVAPGCTVQTPECDKTLKMIKRSCRKRQKTEWVLE